MEGELPVIVGIIIAIALVLANGVFVGAEFALVRTRTTKLREGSHHRKLGGASSLKLLEDLDTSLSATQVGITIASLLLGWWGEHVFQRVIIQSLGWLDESVRGYVSHGVATLLALAVITYLHVVLGELVAKSLAIRYPETTLRWLAPPVLIFSKVCQPIIFFLNGSAILILRLVGIKSLAETERIHSSAELAMLISQSTEGGVFDKDEEEMLKGVFGFSETVAREVMTPRTDLVTIRHNSRFEDVLRVIARTGFSRIPVTGERIDDILGILIVKDVLPYVNGEPRSDFDVRKIMREPYFVPGTKPIDDLLREFQRRKIHLAIVLDEHGGVDGVVTMEDLLEEIVGEIYDESDIPEADVVVQPNGDIVVDGRVLVSDLNSRFQFEIPQGDYDTIAGFVYTSLGRVPRSGDQLVVKENGEIVTVPDEMEELLLGRTAVEFRLGEGGVVEAANGQSELDIPERQGTLLMVVEKVRKQRVDTIRIRFLIPLGKYTESEPISSASQEKELMYGEKEPDEATVDDVIVRRSS